MATTTAPRATTAVPLRTALLLTVTLFGTACFRPRAVDCVLTCGDQNDCPNSMTCSAGLCTSHAACVTTVAAGETHTCATFAGALKCWGRNAAGQLGVGDRADRGDGLSEMGKNLPQVILGQDRVVKASLFAYGKSAIALGSVHTCAVLDRGEVKCWGDNVGGQLGLGDLLPRTTPRDLGDNLPPLDLGTDLTARSLAAGVYHTCANLDSGAVKCWGDNRFGQLGIGAPGNRGGEAGQMGDNLPSVDLGLAIRAKAVAAGAYHTCALLADSGEVKCWGWNDHGQLGLGDIRSRGLGPMDMGAGLPSVDLGEGRHAIQIAAGAFHTCALLAESGEVKCWGLNGAGQLGQGDKDGRGASVATLGDRLPPIDLGAGRFARAITAGATHTCALLDDFSVRCWGLNADGHLGIGSTDNRGDEPAEMGQHLPAARLGAPGVGVSSISAGANHTCAVQGASVKCWGLNLHGRLGVGDRNPRGDGRLEITAVDLFGPGG